MQTDDRVTITEEGDLEISSVEKKDIGEYLCLAINTGGERQSKPAQLRVLGNDLKLHINLLMYSPGLLQEPC